MESNKNTIGGRITSLRKAAGLKQRELAEKLTVSRELVNLWENDLRQIKGDDIARLADTLDTTCDYLLRGVSSENVNAYKATGLSNTTIDLLSELNKSQAYTREFRQSLINHILSSEVFWSRTIPHLQSAWQLRKGVSKEINPDDQTKAEEWAEGLKGLNFGGYTKYVVWEGAVSSDMQIQFAADSMKELFKLIIEDIVGKDGNNSG